MATQYIFFIILSAFLHAFYNLLIKNIDDKASFIPAIFTVSAVAALVTICISNATIQINWQYLPYIFATAFFYSLYQNLTAQSYNHGDISITYPLTVLSPIFIPVWAIIFLKETVTFGIITGIILTVIGAFCVKLSSLSLRELKKVFKFNTAYKGSRLALSASFVYSIAAVIDKAKIAKWDLTIYIFLLLLFIAFHSFILHAIFIRRPLVKFFTANKKHILAGGVIVYFSFLTFRFALKHINVSIAVPLRQIAIVFAIMFGIIILKERFTKSSVIGSCLIIIGITIIQLQN